MNNQVPGQVSFTVDEAELTAMLASELQKQPDQVLQNPKVLLRDGHLTVTGTVKQSGLTADLVVTLAISATQDGHLAYQLQSAQLGPFPLPQDLMGSLSSQLDSVFTNSIYPKFEDTFIESVTIANGQMVIQGHPR